MSLTPQTIEGTLTGAYDLIWNRWKATYARRGRQKSNTFPSI